MALPCKGGALLSTKWTFVRVVYIVLFSYSYLYFTCFLNFLQIVRKDFMLSL
ncbi:hypothetical protein SELSPUOL_01253 [Selenomonas sputigena ATCC 35185]|uniref:Uncharacterized protein n=1 Tax=Selenomonas sputigena (strain ATCC 35185 / DSM 20758 / CCUG 44933 / VPI D19B-28) TaxID=546271 RepID=C9LUW4_SELS3|nr:hypothetical protein SELSPUOL_01253 [Selenomonas sputigena ATCC 35185]